MDLVKLILKTESHSNDLLWDYDKSSAISECNSTLGWKEYWEIKKEMEKKNKKLYKLLLPVVYLDEFRAFSTRDKLLMGIYLRLANQPNSVRKFFQK